VATDLIAGALAARREELVSAAVDAYVQRLASYREAGPDVQRDARRHTEEHHDLLCEVLRRGWPPRERELAFVERIASREGDRVRRDLLEDLLDTGAPQTAAGLAAARAAGLEADAPCVVVAAVAASAPSNDGALPRAAKTLAGGERLALRAPLAKACERTRSQGLVLAVGVSTVREGPASVGAAYREATRLTTAWRGSPRRPGAIFATCLTSSTCSSPCG
jgi:hypothetical protein